MAWRRRAGTCVDCGKWVERGGRTRTGLRCTECTLIYVVEVNQLPPKQRAAYRAERRKGTPTPD